jgi:hypothetical protein
MLDLCLRGPERAFEEITMPPASGRLRASQADFWPAFTGAHLQIARFES